MMPAFFYGKYMVTKEQLRNQLDQRQDRQHDVTGAGKLAETLRRAHVYREAKQIFGDPGPLLAQIRVNSLLDGKQLIMPSPGLRDGYYLLEPYVISFRDLSYATTFKGLAKFGRRLSDSDQKGLAVDLFITAPQAIGRKGGWVGDGLGFFDLTVAAFAAIGGISRAASVCIAAGPGTLFDDDFSLDPWDVEADWLLTENGLVETGVKRQDWPPVFWDRLPKRRIRKITPLWKLYLAGKDAGTLPELL
jgi:5-formyltetrahydrofolate cyclo-ligase